MLIYQNNEHKTHVSNRQNISIIRLERENYVALDYK